MKLNLYVTVFILKAVLLNAMATQNGCSGCLNLNIRDGYHSDCGCASYKVFVKKRKVEPCPPPPPPVEPCPPPPPPPPPKPVITCVEKTVKCVVKPKPCLPPPPTPCVHYNNCCESRGLPLISKPFVSAALASLLIFFYLVVLG